jgi:hypothetical protein
MKLKLIILTIFIYFYSTNLIVGQLRFQCNGRYIISRSNGFTTSLYYADFPPFAPPYLSLLVNYTGDFDGFGFNPKDNYVYSVEQNTNNIVRHSLYNDIKKIGKASIVDTLHVTAGDCTAEGLYICYDNKINKMLFFDVDDNLKLVKQINLFWDPTSPNKGQFKAPLADFAFDPNDKNTAYSHQGVNLNVDVAPSITRGNILKINLNLNDPNVGMVSPLGKVNQTVATELGGFLFSPSSNLYGFGFSSESINQNEYSLFSINAKNGNAESILKNGFASKLDDGCSCPFFFSFENFVPQGGIYCNNDVSNITLVMNNNSALPMTGVTLKDTFPEGTIIKSISENFAGKIDIGIGTNILSISNLTIPAYTKLSITIELESVNAKDGYTYNQAFLYNLPERFPTIYVSDDPFSKYIGDRSNFFFITRGLKKLTWTTIPPTDCLKADDGKIIATSPDFIKGQQYEVSLRNKNGWKEYVVKVVIDQKNSFTIDSLNPGEYQLFRFRSINENCSLSLIESTITVEAPNHLLKLQLTSNSPVCEGQTLYLEGIMSSIGEIEWRGPDIFGSNDFKTSIENTTLKKVGTYKAVGKYGFCTQKKMIEVDVKPQFKTSISGDSSYCVKENIVLQVKTKEKSLPLQYAWTGPNGFKSQDSTINVLVEGKQLDGSYEVISNNGACFDTSTMNITILPTPSIILEKVIKTDYCDPLFLLPKLVNVQEVTYTWSPQEGLTCSDCLSPKVNPKVNELYNLIVKNEYNCTDTAVVNIILDKEKLVYAPNIFSAKSTGPNKIFKIYPKCVVNFIQQLDIYDRFGNKIFNTSSSNPNEELLSWEGQTSGRHVAPGVYIWVIKAELVDGSMITITGDVTVI